MDLQEHPRGGDKFFRAAALVGLAIIIFAAHVPVLGNGFALDDYPHLVHNYQVHSLSGGMEAFFRPFVPGNLYRPLTELSFAATVELFGLAPFWHHLLSLLLHILCTLLIFFCFSHIVGFGCALLAALLFGLMPIHVEAVANIAGRSELLCAFFGLLAIAAGIRLQRRKVGAQGISAALLIALLLLGSFLSKESGLVFVLLAPLTVLFSGGLQARRPLKIIILAGIAATIFYAAMRWRVLGSEIISSAATAMIDNPLVALEWHGRFVLAVALLGRYIALSLAPFVLSADYSYAHLTPTLSGLGGSLQILPVAFFAVAAAMGLRSRHPAAFFATWFFAAFAVTANILFPIGVIFAERLAYIPSAGIAGVLAYTIYRIRAVPLRFAWILLLVGFYGFKSWGHLAVWQSNEALYEYQMSVSPRSVRTLINWGVVLRNRRETARARYFLEKAVKIDPGKPSPDAMYALATLLISTEELQSAEELLAAIVTTAPAHQGALDTLGRIRLKQGRFSEAEDLFIRLEKMPGGVFRGGLGRLAVMINSGRIEQAKLLHSELSLISPTDKELAVLAGSIERR